MLAGGRQPGPWDWPWGRSTSPPLVDTGTGVTFGQEGEVAIGDDFLSGTASQARLRTHLASLEVLWVGVHCDPEIAAGREMARGDRVTGMAAAQAVVVHHGVVYDVEVDPSQTESLDCAHVIAAAQTCR